MLKVTQTILHDPDRGQHGNCFSACLASILHLDIAEVPVFWNPETWVDELQAWLKPMGFCYMEAWPEAVTSWKTSGLHGVCCGPTPRFGGNVEHSCVAVDGSIVWDPHPDHTGLDSIHVIGFLVALQPWMMNYPQNHRSQ